MLNLIVSRSLTRLLFSVSFFARWTTWRRLKLFKNRTGTAQQDTSNSSDQQQQHYWTSFKSSSLVATVTMPWTHSTTTSGTSPSWSTSLVSFVIESWGPIHTFRYSVSPPFTKSCKEHFRCLFVHLLRPLCLKGFSNKLNYNVFMYSSLTVLRYSPQTRRDWEETNSGKQLIVFAPR